MDKKTNKKTDNSVLIQLVSYDLICKKCKKEFKVYHDYARLRNSPNKQLTTTHCNIIHKFPARNRQR